MEDQEQLTLTPSEILSFYRCPRQYYYKYVQKLPRPYSYFMARGLAVHEASEYYYSVKLRLNREPRLSEVVDKFVESLEAVKDTTEWEDTSFDKQVDAGVPAVKEYVTNIARYVSPLWVEQEFGVQMQKAPILLRGRFDVVDRAILLRDIKVKDRLISSADSYTNVQMSAYGFALVKLIKEGELSPPKKSMDQFNQRKIKMYIDVVVPHPVDPKTRVLELVRTPGQLRMFSEHTRKVANFLRKALEQPDLFYPNPNAYSWTGGCEKYCPYYDICKKEK